MPSVVGEVSVSTWEGWFKPVFGKYIPLVPINDKLQQLIKFSEGDSEGEYFTEPIGLQLEHGVTYASANSGAFALDPPIASVTKKALINGSQHVLRCAIDYETCAKANKSQKAFGRALKQQFVTMKESIHKRLEIDLWCGQSPLGLVSAVASNLITIAPAEFAAGFWSGMEGALVEFFDFAGTTQRTGTGKIIAVDIDAGTITLELATLPTGISAGGGGDRIYFKTQHITTGDRTMAGLQKILTNTGSLFGIDAAVYSLWKATSAAMSAALQFDNIQRIIARMVGKGLDTNLVLLVSPYTWADLLVEQAANRRYVTERVRFENGAEAIRFYSQNGYVDIQASFYCKAGYAFLVSPTEWKRVGATDLTFEMPDAGMFPGVGTFFRPLADNAGIEWRCYDHQALYTAKAGRSGVFTGIVNTAVTA